MDFSGFKDKVFVITGGGGAIGGYTAVDLVGYGACVSLIDINKERLQDVTQRCLNNGATEDKVLTYIGDTTNEDTCRDFVTQTMDKLGRIDGLYNVVGKKIKGNIHTAAWDGFVDLYTTGLKSTFTMCQQCLPHLKQTKGTILNMAAITGVVPCYHNLSYSTFSAALYRFTEAIACELSSFGIRVNGIAPSGIKHPDYHRAMNPGMTDSQLQAYFDWIEDAAPLRTSCGPEEVAEASIFLLSDQSSFTTGYVLPIAAGYEHLIAAP